MIRQYIVTVFITISILQVINCSSAEKKNLSFAGKTALSQSYNSAVDSGTGEKSIIATPLEFNIVKPQIVIFSNDDIKVTLYARLFAQGNGVYAEIESQSGGAYLAGLTLSYKSSNIPVTKTSWGFRSLWGIDPEEKPGYAAVKINYNINGVDRVLISDLKITDIEYPVSKTKLNVGKFSDKDYTSDPKFKALIAESSALRRKAFGSVTEDSIQNVISHPRDMHKITGDYWRKRIYLVYQKRKKKVIVKEGKTSFHRGVDLKGAVGSPVFAMADGLVVLSHTMFYEGDMVVVDHGNQVFSYYQHLDSRKVKEGDRVRAGDELGGVGATGMVTGPHLHAAFSIRGVHVDPLSILSLPVRR